ncbi:MAG: AEC family transporter [Amphiplicatus sp.]
MIDTFNAVFPVFILIAFGYAAARRTLFTAEGARNLNSFAHNFGVPALLFRTLQAGELGAPAPWGVWGAYYLAAALVWILIAVFLRRRRGLGEAGGAATAVASTFGNVGMMGLSVAYLAYGEAGVVVAAMVIAIHTAVHWLIGSLWAEWANRGEGVSLPKTLASVFVSLVKNPIVVALALGAAWKAGGLVMPAFAGRFIDLLADAAVPVGLFALGLSVAAYPLRDNIASVATIIALKMVLFPLLAGALSVFVFRLAPMEATLVTLFAAMPTGVNAYLFATRFEASVPAVSGAIALGVTLSVATIPLILWLAGAS